MKNNKYRNANITKILTALFALCIILAMFTGCTISSDTCTDPNCTSCVNVVYAEEYPAEAITIVYVECPDCDGNGGVHTYTTSDCTVCGGDGMVSYYVEQTCSWCDGDLEYEDTTTLRCPACVTAGTDDCALCEDGWIYSSETVACTHCDDGIQTVLKSTYCTASNCDDGEVTAAVWVECETCDGYGGWTETGDEVIIGCSDCDYTGEVDCPDCNGLGYYDVEEQGTGSTIRYTCATCGGSGGRIDATGSTTGTGKVACPSCSGVSYATITFVTNYGVTEAVTATIGEIIPIYRGVSSDSYYLTSDEDGDVLLSKSTLVSGDMTIYVWFLAYEETYDYSIVYFYEYNDGFWFLNSWEQKATLPIITGSRFSDYNTYYTDDIYQLTYDKAGTLWVYDTDFISSDTDMYVHYSATVADPADPDDPDSSSDSTLFEVLFDTDTSLSDYFSDAFDFSDTFSTIVSIMVYMFIAAIVLGILYILFKLIPSKFN